MTSRRDQNRYYDRYKRDKGSRAFYRSTAWETARVQALIRDNYLCQHCIKRKKLTPADMVHHIKPLSDYPDLALVLENLLSLCNGCHNKEHGGPGERGEATPVARRARFIVSKGNSEVF
ncbi:endonuclease [Paenibacillus donghaensis]|uniref:Putative HNH nuclease YajD n=1 Tax=Paenibacillus donghaensis TaxID=414771 RepID=A0A2Z2K9F1_9BACL|nr:HNH endonuclease signature motif containing protein [Paenibacillus donghaensis]ASA22094.1 endonuclease [Paenibacillus donghaensis]